MSEKSEAEEYIAACLLDDNIPFVRQYRFAPPRQWLADFTISSGRILIEIEGGVFANGRHTRGTGFTNDAVKYNTATLLGWRVLRFTTDQVFDGYAYKTITEAIQIFGGITNRSEEGKLP